MASPAIIYAPLFFATSIITDIAKKMKCVFPKYTLNLKWSSDIAICFPVIFIFACSNTEKAAPQTLKGFYRWETRSPRVFPTHIVIHYTASESNRTILLILLAPTPMEAGII